MNDEIVEKVTKARFHGTGRMMYLVTVGSYSDYAVAAVCDNLPLAEEYARAVQGGVEVFEMEEGPLPELVPVLHIDGWATQQDELSLKVRATATLPPAQRAIKLRELLDEINVGDWDEYAIDVSERVEMVLPDSHSGQVVCQSWPLRSHRGNHFGAYGIDHARVRKRFSELRAEAKAILEGIAP